uniref:Uncharacterized protein n=1 Tax=Strigamia maritima TaxID=126957 RepID=T1IW40_STRMM
MRSFWLFGYGFDKLGANFVLSVLRLYSIQIFKSTIHNIQLFDLIFRVQQCMMVTLTKHECLLNFFTASFFPLYF